MKKIIIAIVVVAIVVAGYIFIKGRGSDTGQTYTNTSYGYSLTQNDKYTYQELNATDGPSLSVTDPSDPSRFDGLAVNIIPMPIGGKTFTNVTDYGSAFFSNAIVKPTSLTINGESAITAVLPGDSGASNSKGYYFLHNGMIYEITFSSAENAGFDAIARTFRFVK